MNRLAEIMKEKRFTQQALADRVGTTKSHICDIARARRLPRLDMAIRIARVLGVSVEDIWSPPSELVIRTTPAA